MSRWERIEAAWAAWDKAPAEPRVAVQNEAIDLTGLSPAQFAALFTPTTYAGVSVTPESALRAIPVQACTSLIAGGITSMPLSFFRRRIVDGAWVREPADDHDLWWLFNEQANEDQATAAMWDQVIPRLALRAEAFVRIVRANGGRSNRITELVPIDNKCVQKDRVWDETRRRWRIKRYVINDGGNFYGVDPADMLHFNGKRAMSESQVSAILESCREAIGIVLAVEQWCGRIFSNGGTPRLALTFPSGVKVTEEQKAAIREAWPAAYGGGANSHLPFVVGAGGKIEKISFSASEAQMLEARKFQVIDIARAFGVPPFMIGESEKTSSWGSGIEQMSQGFVRYTLSPYMTAIEQEINRKIFAQQTYVVDFDEEALSRGDMKSIGEWFRQAIGGSQGPGFLTPNEVRRRINQPPIEGGNQLYDPAKNTAAAAADPAKPEESGANAPEVTDDA